MDYSSLRRSLLAMAALLLFPHAALSLTLTLTFDDGEHDPTIASPGGGIHGPFDWIESNGIRAAGFWAVDVGEAGAFFQLGHTHIQPNWSRRPDGRTHRFHSWTHDLQGLWISLESGRSFDVVSVDYKLAAAEVDHPHFQRLDWTWGVDDPQLLLATSFDPTDPDFSGQWTAFGVEGVGERYPRWRTQGLDGFEGVTGVYLSSTAGYLDIDTLVIEVHPQAVPEASTLALLAIALAGLVYAGQPPRRRRAAPARTRA